MKRRSASLPGCSTRDQIELGVELAELLLNVLLEVLPLA